MLGEGPADSSIYISKVMPSGFTVAVNKIVEMYDSTQGPHDAAFHLCMHTGSGPKATLAYEGCRERHKGSLAYTDQSTAEEQHQKVG